jgi:hypothetical protein
MEAPPVTGLSCLTRGADSLANFTVVTLERLTNGVDPVDGLVILNRPT